MNNGVRAVEMTKHLNEAKAAMNTMTDLERKVLAAMIITMATVLVILRKLFFIPRVIPFIVRTKPFLRAISLHYNLLC